MGLSLFAATAALGQLDVINSPEQSVIQLRRVVQAQPDPFNSLISSAASIDMDAAAVATAEFDPPVAATGGRVTYRITVTAPDESLEVPDSFPTPPGLLLHRGGSGMAYESTGAGKMRPLTTFLFHAMASSNGTYTIPAFDALAYGKPLHVPEATLRVADPSEATDPGPPRLLVSAPDGDVYVGQTVNFPLVLPIDPVTQALSMSMPRVTGKFIFAEPALAPPILAEVQRDGQTVKAFVGGVMVTPLRDGPQELIASAYSTIIRTLPGQPNPTLLANHLVDADPLTLTVKPLPKDGELPGFTGAVGNFRADPPVASANQTRAGEPVVVSVTFRGNGNLGRLTPPPAPNSRDWQTFPPTGEFLPVEIIQARGAATFNYTLIPNSDAPKETPAIPFSFFDPQKKAYVDLTIPPVPITVAPSAAMEAAKSVEAPAQTPVIEDSSKPEKELVLTGLAESEGSTSASLIPVQQRWWFLGLQIFPAAALGGLWGWDRRRRHLRTHPEIILKRRARRGLRRQLRLARRAAASRNAAGFAAAATGALREVCAPPDASNPSALVCADVLRELPVAEQQGRAGEMVRRLFAADDALRFGGPVRESSELLALEPDLEQLLGELRAKLCL